MKAPSKLDLTKYATAAGAAKALYKKLREHAERMGQNPDIEVSLFRPGDDYEGCDNGGWHVVWEAGPYEWGIKLSGDYDCDKGRGSDFVGFPARLPYPRTYETSWMAEPWWSFSLVFYPN